MRPATSTALDGAALQCLRDLDPQGKSGLLDRVFKAFETSVARLRPRLREAGRSADMATVRLIAHTLKSSSASIGALRLSQLCAETEAGIRRDELAAVPDLLDAIDHEFDGVLQAVRSMRTPPA